MAKGRPRKQGKRHPCGKLKARRTPDRVEPTPQMKRHKAIASGGEVGNPLSYLPVRDEFRQALDLFFIHKRAAGWGVKCKVATLDDSPRGPAIDPELEAADDLIRAGRYEAADGALLQAGTAAHRQVHNLFAFREVTGSLRDLEAGARALCEHYHIGLEAAA
jgi:hypothetical protein